jgi:hypothetical protein
VRQDERDGRRLAGEGKKLVTGEEEVWFQIAEAQGRSVQETKQATTTSEFVRWEAYFEKKVNAFHRDDYFFAQIAYEIYVLRLKFAGLFTGENVREFKDFLVKYEHTKVKEEDIRQPINVEDMTEEEKAELKEKISRESMARWGVSKAEREGKTAPPKKQRPRPKPVPPRPKPVRKAKGL